MPIAYLNDTDLFYTEHGSGIPCLAMHGGLGLDHMHLRAWDVFGNFLHLVYYDHRHNGRSGRPPLETVTHAQLADDAEALRQHLGLKQVAVFGHSYGGFIALEYALRYPQSVSHLILADTAPAWNYVEEIGQNAVSMGATPEMMEALAATPENDEEFKNMMKVLAPLYFYRITPEIQVELDGLADNTIFCATVGQHQESLLETYNVTSRLSQITCPTLILVGRHDFICPPSQAQIMHKGIPNSRLVEFENSGHFPWVEEREKFIQAVKDWFEIVWRAG